jgi:hypothetical protein
MSGPAGVPEGDEPTLPPELPCPYCGAGEFRWDASRYWTGMRYIVSNVTLRHWCDAGEHKGHALPRVTSQHTARTYEEALKLWNSRHAP